MLLSVLLSSFSILIGIAHLGFSSPVQPSLPDFTLLRNQSSHLSGLPPPECFTFTLAPRLKQHQCNAELEWFLEESRKYDVLDLVGANAPYTYTRSGKPSGLRKSDSCFVTITADDLFVTDQFTYGDLARFTTAILDRCRDGRVMAGKGGMLKMTDGRDVWGGFYLRADAWNPYPWRLGGNHTAPVGNRTSPSSLSRVKLPSLSDGIPSGVIR